MAGRNAIVRHLAAVETLGSATIIASDKTGTLTKNEMTVRTVVTASGRVDLEGTGYAPEGKVHVNGDALQEGVLRTEVEHALIAADRANNAVLQQKDGRWTVQGDPTEGALVVAARKAGLPTRRWTARFERIGEVPFRRAQADDDRSHRYRAYERLLVFTKGAPDILLSRCTLEQVGGEARPLTGQRRQELAATNDELARQALRTLGVAVRELPADALEHEDASETLERELVFLGLIGMIDPPRAEAKPAVEQARSAGIRPMITGDHPTTAAVIAEGGDRAQGPGGHRRGTGECRKTRWRRRSARCLFMRAWIRNTSWAL